MRPDMATSSSMCIQPRARSGFSGCRPTSTVLRFSNGTSLSARRISLGSHATPNASSAELTAGTKGLSFPSTQTDRLLGNCSRVSASMSSKSAPSAKLSARRDHSSLFSEGRTKAISSAPNSSPTVGGVSSMSRERNTSKKGSTKTDCKRSNSSAMTPSVF